MRIECELVAFTLCFVRCASTECAFNANRVKMWIQCASNRIAWAIPDVMNIELIHALERWLLGRRHALTIFRSSRSWLLAVLLDHKRCCRSSIMGENNTTRELARDQSAILIVFPASSVNALDAHHNRL